MSLYYKQKLISGVRDVPSMTLAQYNALTNKPKLWERTDAPEGDRGINADDIQYDSDTSVKEKIDGDNIVVLTGTLPTSGTFSNEHPFPTGFNVNNTVIIGFMVESNTNEWRSGEGIISANFARIFIQMGTTGIKVFTTEGTGKNYKIIIRKY